MAFKAFESISGTKCFIVTDEGCEKVGLVNILTNRLTEVKKSWEIFNKVEPDPKEETVLIGAEMCKKYAPDLIIGLGGGSSMDTAKAIWFLYENEGKNLDTLQPQTQISMGKKAQLIAIPTTSGTGAETTWAVVITRKTANGEFKMELANRDVVPTYALVNPQLTKSLPPKLTANTGMDVMAHACEALISNVRNDYSSALCNQAIELVFTYLPRAFQNGEDMEAREKMAVAATLGGLGFGNANVTGGHALGHAIGALYHLPHGTTVGIVLPYILEYSLKDKNQIVAPILAKTALKVGIVKEISDPIAASQAFIAKIRELQKTLNFPTCLKDCNIAQDDLTNNSKKIISLAKQSLSLMTAPRSWTTSDFSKTLQYIYEGKPIDF